jgi:hypothetical protein
MLSHRHRHRAAARRLFAAALAAVAVVVSSVLILSAPPASAAPPPDFDAKVTRAFNDAKAALQRPDCAKLLTEPILGLFPPGDVLNTATRRFLDVPPPPLPADAGASVQGTGLFQTITFYPGFFKLGTTTRPDGSQVIVKPRLAGRPEIPDEILNKDDNLLRALAILHEVGHLTGVEAQHEARIDEAGNWISAEIEEGLYNTRILNTCFAPPYLIAGATCQQNLLAFTSPYGSSPIECSVTCRPDAGPVVLAWTSSLQSTVTADTSAGGCHSTRVSGCPPPSGIVYGSLARVVFPPTDITITVTDTSGHMSQDTFRVTCVDPNFW